MIGRSDTRRWSLNGTFATIAALLSILPVLLIPIPGFVDVPAHVARHHILALQQHSEALSRYFAVQWHWIANLGVDIPATLMTPALGAEWATRIVTAAIAPLTIAGVIALSRAAHGRVAASAMLALPLVMNQAWMYGFLNYCLGTALALLAAAWIYTKPRDTWAEIVILAVLSVVVWTAHMASWAILLVLAAGNELATLRSLGDVWKAIRRNLPLLLPAIPLVLWRSHSSGSDFAFQYDAFVATKIGAFIGALRGTWMTLDMALVGLIILGCLLAMLSGRRPKLERRLFTSGVMLALMAVAAPEYLLNSWGTDMRVAPIAMILLTLSIAPAQDPRRERAICMVGFSLFLVRLGTVAWTWAQRSPMLEQRLTMLDVVPRGGTLGYLFVRRDCNGWLLEPDEKLASYAVVRRDAFANTLFMVENARLVTLRDPHLQTRWTSDSQRIKRDCTQDRADTAQLGRALADMRRDRFDAIWISGVPRKELPIVPGYAVAREEGPAETMLLRR